VDSTHSVKTERTNTGGEGVCVGGGGGDERNSKFVPLAEEMYGVSDFHTDSDGNFLYVHVRILL
jgi:hypothetical protein